MKLTLAACTLAGLLLGAGACGTSTPSAPHAKAPAGGGVITSMSHSQSMDLSRSCTHTPGQPECATQWTVEYHNADGPHSVTVTESAYNACLQRFPGGHYPDCIEEGQP
jgi:hypothetical protein